MHWTVNGANAIIALRCSRLSGRYEDFWERRRERSLPDPIPQIRRAPPHYGVRIPAVSVAQRDCGGKVIMSPLSKVEMSS